MSEASVEVLKAVASRRTGLLDFGDDRYREWLDVLLAAYDENPYWPVGSRAGGCST
jgi:hypothetical protein